MAQIAELAALVARVAHQAVAQKRKYTGEEYWLHPFKVAEILRRYPHTEEMIAAAYLHDVLEDTHVTTTDLREVFGEKVCHLVCELTDQFTDRSHGNRAKRKALECDRLSKVSAAAQTIKYADLIDNTGSIAEHDPGFATVYLKEKRTLLMSMREGHPVLLERAWLTMVEAQEKVDKFLEAQRENTHKVHINGRHVKTVFSESDAWEFIGRQRFGCLHEVYDADDNIRPEFVPY